MLGHIDEIFVRVAEFIRFLTVNEGLRLDVTVGIADIGLPTVSVATGQRSNDIFNVFKKIQVIVCSVAETLIRDNSLHGGMIDS